MASSSAFPWLRPPKSQAFAATYPAGPGVGGQAPRGGRCQLSFASCPGVQLIMGMLSEKPRSGTPAEVAACERVQQKAAVTLARLSRDPEVAREAVRLSCKWCGLWQEWGGGPGMGAPPVSWWRQRTHSPAGRGEPHSQGARKCWHGGPACGPPI